MAALNILVLWLFISAAVGSAAGHLFTQEVGKWVSSGLFFAGLAVGITASSGPGRTTRSDDFDVPVHHDVEEASSG